jgi:DDE domain
VGGPVVSDVPDQLSRSHAHAAGPRRGAVDKNAAYPKAATEMKKDGELWRRSRLRQVKYLNNIVEQDHRRVKRLTGPGLGFGGFWTARRTLAGYEGWGVDADPRHPPRERGSCHGQFRVIRLTGNGDMPGVCRQPQASYMEKPRDTVTTSSERTPQRITLQEPPVRR